MGLRAGGAGERPGEGRTPAVTLNRAGRSRRHHRCSVQLLESQTLPAPKTLHDRELGSGEREGGEGEFMRAFVCASVCREVAWACSPNRGSPPKRWPAPLTLSSPCSFSPHPPHASSITACHDVATTQSIPPWTRNRVTQVPGLSARCPPGAHRAAAVTPFRKPALWTRPIWPESMQGPRSALLPSREWKKNVAPAARVSVVDYARSDGHYQHVRGWEKLDIPPGAPWMPGEEKCWCRPPRLAQGPACTGPYGTHSRAHMGLHARSGMCTALF